MTPVVFEGARSQAHGANASVLLRGDQACVLEDTQVLHERGQRHRERCRELGHDSRRLRQSLHDGPARRVRESAEHCVELVVIVRHTPNYCGGKGARQRLTSTGPRNRVAIQGRHTAEHPQRVRGGSDSMGSWLVGGAGGNRTRVLERRARSSPGAVSGVAFSAPALALTRRRQAQSGKSPAQPS